ncbi:MAG: primosomal protein N' [Thermodesulfobacteriota bacterium]|nr:primosomal protein N' [Thermodesulfobacteriota bacterium]
MFANVAVSIPSARSFTYAVPEGMEDQIAVGKRVLVPFGMRKVTGYIVGTTTSTTIKSIKSIIELLDAEPLFNETDLEFYNWAADYYMHPLGKTLKASLPGGIDVASNMWVSLAGNPNLEKDRLSDTQRGLLGILTDHPRGLSASNLKKTAGRNSIFGDLRTLQSLQFVILEDRLSNADVKKKTGKRIRLTSPFPEEIKLTEKQGHIRDFLEQHGEVDLSLIRDQFKNVLDTITRMEGKGLVHVSTMEIYRSPARTPHIGEQKPHITLNGEQEAALAEIAPQIKSGGYFPCLLHGVTGSGKTEVYLRAIEETIKLGGSAIYLVPEITLTPQLMSRIRNRFDEKMVAILHSGIGQSAKYDEWRRIQRGEARIVTGARSAIFAPIRDLRLIIVDEEHDSSYKQNDHFAYNARDLAIVKAKQRSATVILGSATPGIQTYFNTQNKDFKLIELAERVEGRALPIFDIVDMKQEGGSGKSSPVFSKVLTEAIRNTLDNGKQTILFLNRRGFHTFLYCLDCGYIFKCLNCSVSMTHHKNDNSLQCHYCDFRIKAPPICPSCGGARINSYGMGTEKVEEEIAALFPGVRVGRMDSDSTSKRGSYENILKSLDRGKIDILVGTQMITKGHDFHDVTLVGIVSADNSLNIPDFRAAEKTFQILTQVAGRGGRGDSPGRVIIQTFNPDNSAIQMARDHNYISFYNDEMQMRKELGYPPFSRMVNLTISATNQSRLTGCVKRLSTVARDLARQAGDTVQVLGPAEAPLSRVKGRYRWHMLLKGTDLKALHSLAADILTKTSETGLRIRIDVDPVNFM